MIKPTVLTFVTLTGCGHKGNGGDQKTIPQGGQDGGGGMAQSSTAEQVRATIVLAQKLIAEPDARLNILVRFAIDWNGAIANGSG